MFWISTYCLFHTINFKGQQAHSTAESRTLEIFEPEYEIVAGGASGIRGMYPVYFHLVSQSANK